MCSTANSYHIIPFLMEVRVYMCWHMRADVYSDLLHYFYSFGIYLCCRSCSSRIYVDIFIK